MIGLFDGMTVPIQDQRAYESGDIDAAMPSTDAAYDIVAIESDGSQWPIVDRVPHTMAMNWLREWQPRNGQWPRYILRASQ